MKQTIYAIADKAAQIYLTPLMVSRNDVVPVREFQQITNNPDSIINKHPEDFALDELASIDLETGEVEQTQIRTVTTALDLLPKTE